MNKRDYFAGIVLKEIISELNPMNIDMEAKYLKGHPNGMPDYAKRCYEIADIMVEASGSSGVFNFKNDLSP